MHNYSDGDELYLFGFSRGAFTVRSLAGLIGRCGLLPKDHAYWIPEAYGHYRLPHNDDSRQTIEDFRSINHVRDITIRFVGVWDTVGSLGIPIEGGLIGMTLVLFVAAWVRGGFPIMGKVHPALLRVPKAEKARFKKSPEERIDDLVLEFKELARQRERLKRDIRSTDRKMKAQSPKMRGHYKKKKERLKKELQKAKDRIKELEELRAEELASGDS